MRRALPAVFVLTALAAFVACSAGSPGGGEITTSPLGAAGSSGDAGPSVDACAIGLTPDDSGACVASAAYAACVASCDQDASDGYAEIEADLLKACASTCGDSCPDGGVVGDPAGACSTCLQMQIASGAKCVANAYTSATKDAGAVWLGCVLGCPAN